MRIALILLCAVVLAAEESPAIANFTKAMGGSDVYAKRDAIKALAGASAGLDREVYPLLMQAIGDRQTHDFAVEVMRQRSNLTPPARGRGSAYPGYPVSDELADWQAWFGAWQKDDARKKEMDDALKKKSGPQTANPNPASGQSDDTASTPTPPAVDAPRIPIDDLGKIDRIVYKSGRTLSGYLRSRRLDGDGALVSIRVVHRDGIGEETIAAALIARIEEDIE